MAPLDPHGHRGMVWGVEVGVMHPRNRYARRRERDVDWSDEEAKRVYTESVLRRDFGVTCTLARDRLCPALPNRLNYIHWLEDILQASGTRSHVAGLDIGTGHAAIFAVLLCAMHPDWHMTGTDTDASALVLAQAMLRDPANQAWSRRMTLRHTPQDTLLPQDMDACFTICNPPFYASAEERERLREAKASYQKPCTAHDAELYTPEGEVGFVRRLVHESTQHRERIAWYTTMLGRHASVGAIVTLLRQRGIENYALTELTQGRTRRWALAWSFGPHRLPDTLTRRVGPSLHAYVPPSCHRTWNVPLPSQDALAAQLHALDTLPPTDTDLTDTSLTVWTLCWTRTARRARQRGESTARKPASPLLVLHLDVEPDVCIHVSWTYGLDRWAFDSLCQHILHRLRPVTKRVATA